MGLYESRRVSCSSIKGNRLTTVAEFDDYADYTSEDPSQVVEYTYDYQNRLVRKVLDSNGDGTADSSTVFVHDGNQIALQFDKTGSGDLAAADLSHRYLWGPAVDQLLADETVDDGGPEDVQWTLTDHLNTVRDLVSYNPGTDTTTVEGHITYDAFGNVTNTPAVDILFGYTGRLFDEATGLQNNLNRWYDPAVGRWVSEDPIGFAAGDANLNRYCANGPVNVIDPSGLAPSVSFFCDPNWITPDPWPGMQPVIPGIGNDIPTWSPEFDIPSSDIINPIGSYPTIIIPPVSDGWKKDVPMWAEYPIKVISRLPDYINRIPGEYPDKYYGPVMKIRTDDGRLITIGIGMSNPGVSIDDGQLEIGQPGVAVGIGITPPGQRNKKSR